MKLINLFFYYQRKKNYRRKIHRRNIFVGDSVGKLITDGICVLRWRKNSVGKTVKSCSDIDSYPSISWKKNKDSTKGFDKYFLFFLLHIGGIPSIPHWILILLATCFDWMRIQWKIGEIPPILLIYHFNQWIVSYPTFSS
jgi:hypothetical protein